jgi:hypothetical protein
MRRKSTWRWVGLALLGLVVAVGVAFVASGLASRQIGLASEPIDAGRALAPAVQTRTEPHRATPAPPAGTGEPSESAPTIERTPPVEAPPPVEAQPPVEAPPPAQTGDEGGGGHADD